jgi:DNA-binding beta-propeller fold protein YncE
VAGTENPDTAATDDALRQSALAGGWEILGAIGAGVAATGLAYDPSRDVVFAVAPQVAGNDQLVTLDPATGAKTGTVATLSQQGLTALAYDPDGDRLFAIHADAEIFGNPWSCGSDPVCVSTLLEIDPDDGTTTVYGELNALIVGGAVQGLAWDSTEGALYGSTAAGLFRIGLGCSGGACSDTSQVDNLYRKPSSLTYDPDTDTLYRQGTLSSRTELDAIDPASGGVEALIGVGGMTAGGLAVIPVPEAEGRLMLASGLVMLISLGRRRGRRG